MELALLIAAMVIVGVFMGWMAGFIWKGNRPMGVKGDYVVSVAVAVVIGLMDWFVIPAMGFSENLRNMGVAMEPALGALLVLWIIRLAKR